MAWIESHQALERHPKTAHLMALMNWDLDTTLGKLHRFWWWCLDYAIEGDLRKFNDTALAAAVGLNGNDSKRFVEAMIAAGWLDRDPYFRIHDWWSYVRNFVQGRWSKTPESWRKIERLYTHRKGRRKPATFLLEGRQKVGVPTVTNRPTVTDLPNTSTPPPPPREEGIAQPTENHWGSPEALIELYNAQAPDECPAVETLSPARLKKAQHHLAQFPRKEFWEETFQEIHRSAFLRGLHPQPGHEHFRATFDWLLAKGKHDGIENVVKVQEGRYRDAEKE